MENARGNVRGRFAELQYELLNCTDAGNCQLRKFFNRRILSSLLENLLLDWSPSAVRRMTLATC